MMAAGVVIIGASHGGVQLAHSLRQKGYEGAITLVSDEATLPYHRPPLSKSFLSESAPEATLLKPESFYHSNAISLKLNARATSLNRRQREIDIEGEPHSYDHLVLATGARARFLPDAAFDNVCYLRDQADADRLRRRLSMAASVVIVGGGFIGLEVAATARKLGKTVTIIEAQSRLLARSLPASVADYVATRHLAEGSKIVYGARVREIEGLGDMAKAVRLDNGERLEADLFLVGIGSVANTELAEKADLQIDRGGISVDCHLRSSDPSVFAIGDCATFPSPFSDEPIRLESVQNAADQARAVATTITGDAAPFTAVPWFWTDQFDMKIQMAGLAQDGTWEIQRGDPTDGSFSLLQLKDCMVVSAFSINAAADHMAARKLIGSRVELDPALASDPRNRLKECVKASSQ